MKFYQTQYAALLITILFMEMTTTACNEQSNPVSQKDILPVTAADTPRLVFDKLVGTWKAEDGKSFERWTKKVDGTFRSVVFSIKGSDTSWNEQADIYPENGRWIFENTVSNQNGGKAVKFTSSLLTGTAVQFSNPAHDFPTDVNYTVPDTNTVNAFIIGPNNKGGRDTIPYNYTRMK